MGVSGTAAQIFERHLADWAVRGAACLPDSAGFKPLHDDGFFAISSSGLVGSERLRARFAGVGEFEIDFESRTISVCVDGASQGTIDHLLLDQLLPRMLAHQGKIVLHAAGVQIGEEAILLVGPSGAGKSTLAATLERLGLGLLGDDAMILDFGRRATASPVYRSLRLHEDSVAHVFGGHEELSDVATYTRKKQAAPRAGDVELPVAAIFFLDQQESPAVCVSAIEGASACFALIGQCFALDPAEIAGAKNRLTKIGRIVGETPIFELRYPRNYSDLPLVHQRLLAALDGKDSLHAARC